MAATVRASYYGASASEPAGATAETGIVFSREDSQTGATPIPIPGVAGTNFSWYKQLALQVSATAATTISNRRIQQASSATTGLFLFFQFASSYVQAAVGNKPSDAGTNGNTPTGYTLMSTSPQVYDSAGVSAGSAGRNGGFALCVCGVDNTYVGGAGSGTALPNVQMLYDEA